MRRISMALALVGAAAVAGCGVGAKPASTAGTKGAAGSPFTVTVNNQGPGTVVSTPAGINCAASTTCAATFAADTTVVLTGTPTGTNYFNGWFGDCAGAATCTLAGAADKYVVSYFSAKPQAHPTFNDPALHAPAFGAAASAKSDLNCATCHGASLGGLATAPACSLCHTHDDATVAGMATALNAAASARNAKIGSEACGGCHATQGTAHQARYNEFANGINPATSKFAASIVSVVSSPGTPAGTFKSTVTFTLTKAGTTACVTPASLKQKTMMYVAYDSAAKKFPTPSYKQTADVDPDGTVGGQNTESLNFTYGSMTLTDAATCTFTMVKDGLPTNPLAQANAFAYGYFGDANVAGLEGNLNPGGRHYALMDNMISVAKALKSSIDYTSTATVTGCERCHGAPYSKHGYRQATVAGLNDFVACKACHTDFRRGTDAGWYLGADVPGYAGATITSAQKVQYAYTANLMNDTHNSHAFEFTYPQSMANCTTCHEGKLDRIITDAKFDGLVCKSCHPTTNTTDNEGRAPSFAGPKLATALSHHTFNWVDVYDASHVLVGPAGTLKETDATTGAVTYLACTACHADDIADGFAPGVHLDPADPKAHDGVGPMLFNLPTPVPLFKDLHPGRIASVYAADGSKYSASMKTSVGTTSFAANKLTLAFSVSNVPAGVTIKPTVNASLYGYDTKDFVVSGHSSQFSPATPNLEWAEGACLRGTGGTTGVACSPANTTRLDVTPLSSAGNANWTATIDLTTWASMLADGSVKRIEVGFLPDAALADGTAIAISGLTVTYDLVAKAVLANTAGKGTSAIVDSAKCNKCHEALGTTFHTPGFGSAGVVGCRLCHFVGSGSSHLEMQSRSIDSFVHAIHSYQVMDSKNVDFANAAAAFEYTEHTESVYPNFSIQNCESCHNPGTYNPPAQNRSLPGISSASWAFKNKTTNIPATILAVVSGPADRACGSCHRSKMINEDQLADVNGEWGLTSFNQHTADYGYRITKTATTGADATTESTVIAGLKSAGLLP